MSPWLFNVYVDAVMKEVMMGRERKGVTFLEEAREWRLPGVLYADDLVPVWLVGGGPESDSRTVC